METKNLGLRGVTPSKPHQFLAHLFIGSGQCCYFSWFFFPFLDFCLLFFFLRILGGMSPSLKIWAAPPSAPCAIMHIQSNHGSFFRLRFCPVSLTRILYWLLRISIWGEESWEPTLHTIIQKRFLTKKKAIEHGKANVVDSW